MADVPVYALYGETVEDSLHGFMHCESIAARSSLYEWEIRSHRHEAFFQILYIRGGSCEAEVDGRRTVLRPPVVLATPPLIVHGFVFSRDVDGLVLTMPDRTVGQSLSDAPQLLPFFDTPRLLDLDRAMPDEANRVDGLFATIAAEFAGSAAGRVAVIRGCLSLLFVRLARLLPDQTAGAGPHQTRQLDHLHRFRQLVDAGFRQRRQVDAYAGQLGITATHLNRICREVLGTSALGVINRRILLEAERDLIYTSLPVGEVAHSLGFADPAYFSRFFAKHAACSPREFRSRYGDRVPPGITDEGVPLER